MCTSRYFDLWQCGCRIVPEDRVSVKICKYKVRNPTLECPITPEQEDDNRSNSSNFGNINGNDGDAEDRHSHHESSPCAADGGADEQQNSRTIDHGTAASVAEEASSSIDDWECLDGTSSDDGTVVNALEIVGKACESGENEAVLIAIPDNITPETKKVVDQTDQANAVASKDGTTTLGSGLCNNCSPKLNERKMEPVSVSPRRCGFHEMQFEQTMRAYWKSEMQWLEGKLWRRCTGIQASQLAAHLQTVFTYRNAYADWLWDLHYAWKYVNGGDSRGSVIVSTAMAKAENNGERESRNGARIMRKVLNRDEIGYSGLQWALDELLEPLRASLHPREMAA